MNKRLKEFKDQVVICGYIFDISVCLLAFLILQIKYKITKKLKVGYYYFRKRKGKGKINYHYY